MWLFIAVLALLAFGIVLARYLLLKQELGRMATAMEEIRAQPTNRQLTVGSQQPQLAQLAIAVNALYEDEATRRAAHLAVMDEMRQSLAGISHDLRTPLTSILGYLKLLRKAGNTAQQQEHDLAVAYNKAEALQRLVNGLFEMARLETGGYMFEHQKLDAVALLGEELAGAYNQLEQAGKLPQVTLPEEPLPVIGDKAAISRVFGNLLQNMLRHGENPMSISGERRDNQVVFYFTNGAPGTKAEDIPRLFDRFFTRDRMRSGENTGLGLSLVQEFMQQMGGGVEVELYDGTLTFTVYWPAA